MKDHLKVISIGLALICIIPLIIINEPQNEEINEIDDTFENNESENYLNNFNFSQKNLRLNKEFVQYKIKFHKNTTVNYDYFLSFRVKDLNPLYYFIVFTDGKKGVMKRKIDGRFYEAPIIGHSIIPSGIILDINLNKIHLSIGKLLFRILPIGNIDSIKGDVEVKAGTEWFLTLGVLHSIVDETFYISLNTENKCFEVIQLDRSSNIGYLTSVHNDFSGFYFGIKILSRGISFAKDISKKIITKNGSIIRFSSTGHLKGNIEVVDPEGKKYNKNTGKLASFQYYGNNTGEWIFSSSGIGFPWKHVISLFYIDVDPHYNLIDF
jgi:hypothetical protein